MLSVFLTSTFVTILDLENILQAPVWVATVTDHVKTLQSRAEASNAMEARVVKAEGDLRMARELVQVVSDQVDAISLERNLMK